jgi:hypothetical protein
MRERRPFPYVKVARLWSQGKTISQIAQRTGYVDEGREDGDRYHTMRVWLGRMHKGYRDRDGRLVKLPYRASRAVVRAAKARSAS